MKYQPCSGGKYFKNIIKIEKEGSCDSKIKTISFSKLTYFLGFTLKKLDPFFFYFSFIQKCNFYFYPNFSELFVTLKAVTLRFIALGLTQCVYGRKKN